MNKRSLKDNKKRLELFKEYMLEQEYFFYFVTLTYAQKIKPKNKGKYIYFKQPKQGLAINRDMKKFNDGLTKYCRRKEIKLEYLFLYARHDKKKEYYDKKSKSYKKVENSFKQPHFHGILALSERKFLKKEIRKYWGNGFIKLRRLYTGDDLVKEIEYLEKNMNWSKENYEYGKKIISQTRRNAQLTKK
jgi:hypothetical protein